jgi:hypothetical protein
VGASGDRLRLELQGSDAGGAGDVQVLLDGDRLSVIDPGTNTVYRITLPKDANKQRGQQANEPVPSVARIQRALMSVAQDATVSGARPANVAGRPAYSVRVSPRHDGGLLGGVELAWDAAHGVPLRAAVLASGNGNPVLELRATDISFGPVAAGDLTVPEPAGAKVVDLSAPGGGAGHKARQDQQPVTGLDAVQARVPFKVVAPDELVGLNRREVRLIDHGGSPGALVTYGQGLGGIAVIQTAAEPGNNGAAGMPGGLSLPKISINGASGEELDTALGTVLRFRRRGVGYTVLGSVPPTAAEAAARAL